MEKKNKVEKKEKKISDEYFEIFDKYREKFGEKTVLFMQVGSFYELYGIETETEKVGCVSEISELLNIQKTRKNKKELVVSRDNPMLCGIPCVALKKYLDVMRANYYTVVIMDQTNTVNSKKIERKVVEIISPGTYMEEKVENESSGRGNKLVSILCMNENTKVTKGYTGQNQLKSLLTIGISMIDIITGQSLVYEIYGSEKDKMKPLEEAYRFLISHNPTEAIINYHLIDKQTQSYIENYLELTKYNYHSGTFCTTKKDKENNQEKVLDSTVLKIDYQNQFLKKVYPDTGLLSSIEFLDLETKQVAAASFVLLLQFAYEHNDSIINSLPKPSLKWNDKNKHMTIAYNAINQLNITPQDFRAERVNKGDRIKFKALYPVVNNCSTSLGKRLLLKRIVAPSTNVDKIQFRYQCIEEMSKPLNKNANASDPKIHELIGKILIMISDLDQYHRRISLAMLSPLDFVAMNESYNNVLNLFKTIDELPDDVASSIKKLLPHQTDLQKFKEFISEYHNSFDMKEMAKCIMALKRSTRQTLEQQQIHSFFLPKINPNIDSLQLKINQCTKYMNTFASKLSIYIQNKQGKASAEDSGFVKVDCSDKDGFYLSGTAVRCKVLKQLKQEFLSRNKQLSDEQLTQSYFSGLEKHADFYIKNIDTLEFSDLTSVTRISSEKFRAISKSLISFKSDMCELTKREYQSFLLKFSDKYLPHLHAISKSVAELDVVFSLTRTALMYGYCKPVIKQSSASYIKAKDIRHPIIERLIDHEYVTNDLTLGATEEKINGILLYGPNSAGKSSLMKAIPCCQILAQLGSYVPASTYQFSPFDRIFTRIGGDDNMFQGRSSFVVEMQELRTILNDCDEYSLICTDEICRGSESESSSGIVASAVYHLAKKKTNFIFATHLHDIPKFDEIKSLTNIKSYHLEMFYDTVNDTVKFGRKIKEGSGNSLYGIEVAKSLDLDKDFIETAFKFREQILKKTDDQFLSDVLTSKKSRYNSKVFVDKCKICGKNSNANLEVHHINEQKDANEYGLIQEDGRAPFHKNKLFNLMVLCTKCHDDIHEGRIDIKNFMRQ